jgi:hypothetical protein
MEIKGLKSVLKKYAKTILKILKDIKALPNVWQYILISVVLIIIFLIFTFPYSTLIRKQLQLMGESIGRSAEIGEVNFNLFTGTSIDNMAIILKDGSEISFQNIDLNIGIFSALFGNSLNGEVKINNIKYSRDKTSVNMVARSDFSLKFISMSEFPASGQIKLDLQNVIANGIMIKEFDIPPVRFTSINADAGILKRKITIDSFNASGPDIKGSISGSIIAAQSFQQSQLNLNVSVDSSSPFLENYRILLSKWIDSSNKIQLMIRGSIANPNIDAMGQKSDVNPNVEPRFEPRANPAEPRNLRRPAANPSSPPSPPGQSAVRPQPAQQFVPPEPNRPANTDEEED